MRQQYKHNKLTIMALTWNDDFELPDGSYSVSDIQDYTEHIIQKHEWINNTLVFKIKDGYKLELKIP